VKIAVTGASGVIGRGVVARLLSRGHDVVGLARHRPDSWPTAADFVQSDIRDAAAVRRAVAGTDVVVHCAWSTDREVNIGGFANVLDAVAHTGTRRLVLGSSAHVLSPVSAEGRDIAQAEEMLADSGAEWIAIRSATILGRDVDNWVRRVLAAPAFPDSRRTMQVVHSDDVHRIFVRAIVDADIGSGPVNLAAPGELTLREVASVLGRPVLPIAKRLLSSADLDRLLSAPSMDTAMLRDTWDFTTAWSAVECVQDFALAVRGRIGLRKRGISLPWRLTHAQDIPSVDVPAADGVAPVLAGPDGANGEFDTPIDPRFPTYLATNLSEALPGPFSPSSASVTVQGLRAGGAIIARRLRPGGLIQREMATRTIGVFAHRLYGAITTAHFMAEIVPFVKPATVIRQSHFFGHSVASLPIYSEHRLPRESGSGIGPLRIFRNLGVFGVNLAGLTVGARHDTKDFVDDIDRLEELASGDLSSLSDARLQSLILLARDDVVHGWVLASGSFMAFAAFNVLLRGLNGRDMVLPVGQNLASAQPLSSVYRLADVAQCDPEVSRILAAPGDHLDELRARTPEFHAAVMAELKLMGHRGPAELEMRSVSYADDPEMLLRMVVKSLNVPTRPQTPRPSIPLRARPIASLAAHQLRDREVRRDRMVRSNWLLRNLLRELGRRLVNSGAIAAIDDVFYLLVDELDALPTYIASLVARRRAEQQRLAGFAPPAAFSGSWQAAATSATAFAAGATLNGVGVGGGRARGRVRIVRPETIDDLEPGEVLVAHVTDVGYTAAFCYAAAVVTELGGPMSHAAVVAREFDIPCVVDVADATRRLPQGALVEVDGDSGEIRLLELDMPSVAP
jgi:nucleoside-diphosphate-sugar epimerase/phosphohistidine swiveling domain-containing protein